MYLLQGCIFLNGAVCEAASQDIQHLTIADRPPKSLKYLNLENGNRKCSRETASLSQNRIQLPSTLPYREDLEYRLLLSANLAEFSV